MSDEAYDETDAHSQYVNGLEKRIAQLEAWANKAWPYTLHNPALFENGRELLAKGPKE